MCAGGGVYEQTLYDDDASLLYSASSSCCSNKGTSESTREWHFRPYGSYTGWGLPGYLIAWAQHSRRSYFPIVLPNGQQAYDAPTDCIGKDTRAIYYDARIVNATLGLSTEKEKGHNTTLIFWAKCPTLPCLRYSSKQGYRSLMYQLRQSRGNNTATQMLLGLILFPSGITPVTQL